jgi:hypothetical protein
MKTISRTEVFDEDPKRVFAAIDDLGVTGSHMTGSSAMMMGSKLKLEYFSKNKTGPGTKYRWTGRMMGIPMDFTVEVSKWIAGKEKSWETIGPAHLIIYLWYRMLLTIESSGYTTVAHLSITYRRPDGFFNRIISFMFADLYCNWCLKKMLGDARKALSKEQTAAVAR